MKNARLFILVFIFTFAITPLVFISVSSFADSATPSFAQDETFIVTGQVSDQNGPIEDIQLFFDCCALEWSTRTDANGVYTFTTDGPQMNASIITFPSIESQLGQETRRLDIVGNTSNVNFHLEPGNLLVGHVVNQNGLPANLDHDLLNSQGAKLSVPFNDLAGFAVYVPPDEYTLVIGPQNQPWQSFNIDLRNGDINPWQVVINVDDEDLNLPEIHEVPPIVEKITIGSPDKNNMVHVIGSAGAIAQDIPYLDIINLHTGAFTTTTILADGSFEASIHAPYGSALQFRYNRWNSEYQRASDTGTIVWIYPENMRTQDSNPLPLYLVGRAGNSPGIWTATGTINQTQVEPGNSFSTNLDISISSPQIDDRFDNGEYKLVAVLNFERFFDVNGQHHSRVQRGISTSFTPTGLPIDAMSSHRLQDYTPLNLEKEIVIQSSHRNDETLNFNIDLNSTIPLTMPHGLYRPALTLRLGTDEWLAPLVDNPLLGMDNSFEHRAELGFEENKLPAYLPIIRLGNPASPCLPWLMLANSFNNGSRGIIAQEERPLIGLSNRIAYQPNSFTIAPYDQYKRLISYRLEPFIPTLGSSLANDVEPYPPIIPLVFPSGNLEVTVIRPDGTEDYLGSALFQQARNGMQSKLWHHYINNNRTLQKIYEVTTLDDGFSYEFEQYGRYQIIMEGEVEDVWGNKYKGGGTYEVWVAETLDLETTVFPGQPFEIGDLLATNVVVRPAVPADITIDFTLVPSNGIPITHTVTGQANRYGNFQIDKQPFEMPVDGEYIMDVFAQYWDDQGVLWTGTSRGASVVETPDKNMIAHGLRGITTFTDDHLQWFLTSQIHPGGAKENSPDMPEDDGFMMLYPYHTGDILWVSDKHNSIIADISVQDLDGWYANLLTAREEQFQVGRVNRSLGELITLNELPLVTTTQSGYDWSLFPETIDQWGYAYISTQRPGVSVRGYVGTDNLFRSYWSTDYLYDRQLGTGSNGDVENDVKLQFGGAVIRAPAHKEYLGYASMEVLIPFGQDALGIRTFPPFQGYSGGPDGGPIMILNGEEIDLFLTPTALHPGSIFEVGDSVHVAGIMWPTLDSKGTFTVTSPLGNQSIISGQANRFGYFYPEDGSFIVNEPGLWTVEVNLQHDAVVPSTGLAPSAQNTGDLLGARKCAGWSTSIGCGQFYFYVTAKDTPDLQLDMARIQQNASVIPITFEGNLPSDWTNVQGKFTTSMPGYILEEGDLTLKNGQFQYTFNPWTLHANFPNLDIVNSFNAPELADTFTFSFFISGINQNGEKRSQARTVILQGPNLQALPHSSIGIYKVNLPVVLK